MHSQELAEYIGGESCFIRESDVADIKYIPPTRNIHRRTHVPVEEKNYPPPMEWSLVMRKYSTSDGRVVLKEEKVKRHQYLLAHRSDCRLLLNLQVDDQFDDFPEDMDGEDDPTVVEEKEEKEEEEVGSCCNNNNNNNMYNESGVINPTCGGFEPAAAFGPPVLT